MQNELIIEALAAQVMGAPRGGKAAIITRAAGEHGVSEQTIRRWIGPALRRLKPRKRRADAGDSVLTDAATLQLIAMYEETRRRTGTGTASMEEIIAIAWANGVIHDGYIDKESGEITPPSASTVFRRAHTLRAHPDELAQPTPAVELASPYPNWCWQIDASVSRQFYLADDGARILDKRQFYRGKPGNFAKINERRIWRYVVTDHCSGAFELFYVQGAESALNLLSALIYAMTKRSNGTMHGVPHMLMTDPGSGMTASATANFCTATDIDLKINEVGNARAKGQVEKTHHLVETRFESALKFTAPVTSIAEIQRLAEEFTRYANAAWPLQRNGTNTPRRDRWLTIPAAELRLAPPVEQLRTLANSAPKSCTVKDGRIRFRGAKWDVTGVPELLNGDKIEVLRNPFDADATVRIVRTQPDGRIVHLLAPRLEIDVNGFSAQAAEIGTEYKRLPETPADVARKQIERLAMQAATDEEAAAKRKAKYVPFGGHIDPFKHMRETVVIPALPRAGTPAVVNAPETREAAPMPLPPNPPRDIEPLNHAVAALVVKKRMEQLGGHWAPWCYTRIVERWPDGMPEEQAEPLAEALARATRLQAVGGDA